MKENALPVYKPKHNVLFAALEQVNKIKTDWRKIRVNEKIDYSDWASPIRKK